MEALAQFIYKRPAFYVITAGVMAFDIWLNAHMKKQGFLNTRKGQEHRTSLKALAAAVEKTLGHRFTQVKLNKFLSGLKEMSAIEALHLARALKVSPEDLIREYEPHFRKLKKR
jgi:hypothetical protein